MKRRSNKRMRIKAASIYVTDCEPGAEEAFNRWYDLDHLPEYGALPEVAAARRYVATQPMLQARESVKVPQLLHGKGAYVATYFTGDPDPRQMAKAMHDLAGRLREQGRVFKQARKAYSEEFVLCRTYASQGSPVSVEAVPFIGHTGMMMSFWEIEESHRDEIEEWWDGEHMPRIMQTRGIVGGLRFESTAPGSKARFMFQLLTDGDPLQTLNDVQASRKALQGEGHMGPLEQGWIKRNFTGVFSLVAPLRYEFLRAER